VARDARTFPNDADERLRMSEPSTGHGSAPPWPPRPTAERTQQTRSRYFELIEAGASGDDAAAIVHDEQLAADLQAYIAAHEHPAPSRSPGHPPARRLSSTTDT
jgi:hypothetical protein